MGGRGRKGGKRGQAEKGRRRGGCNQDRSQEVEKGVGDAEMTAEDARTEGRAPGSPL